MRTSARSNGTTSFSTASTSSIVPGSAKERVLMLYFNTNVGATLLRGKGGGWSWLSGCFGPCERAGREPFGHTSRLEPQPRGAVTRRAVAQRRSRASGLTRPLAEAIRGFDSGFGLDFVVGQAVECDHPGAITDNVRPCAPLRLIQPGLALEPGIEAGHSGVEPRDVMAFADRFRSGYRSHSGGCAQTVLSNGRSVVAAHQARRRMHRMTHHRAQ